MIRIEIIANHSVEENILEAFQPEGVEAYYTKIPGVFGVGSSGPRMGDAIWPEENFILVIWCEKEVVAGIERAVAAVKELFPDEGVKLFKMGDTSSRIVYLPPPTGVLEKAPSAQPAYRGPEGENS
jgi:hypothetical protein